MRSRLALILVFSVACTQGGGAPEEPTRSLSDDVRAVGEHFRTRHADLGALIDPGTWDDAVAELAARGDELDANEALVELMRLSTLPARTGGGDGHSGIFPLDDHDRTLHLLPLRLYSFLEGLYVVDAAPLYEGLIGREVTALAGTPVAEVAALVEPLVPRDNEMTVTARLPQFLVTTEVLDGLGLVDGTGSVEVTFEDEFTERIESVRAGVFAEEMGLWHPMIPPSLPAGGSLPYLRHTLDGWWSDYLGRGDAVYVQYNQTLGDSSGLGRRVGRLVRRHDPRAVVLDLRHNPGGENAASAGLIEGLRAPEVRRLPLYVLVGRSTFSAAGYLCLNLEKDLDPVFAGEPTGFSTHFFGDPESTSLEVADVTVNAGGVLWRERRNGSPTEPLVPDLEVTLEAEDYFGANDAVLEAVFDEVR